MYNEDDGLIEFNKRDDTSIDVFGPYNKGGNFKNNFYLVDDKGFYEGGRFNKIDTFIFGVLSMGEEVLLPIYGGLD
ncbi:MAG: hypothetical protein ACOXZZ_02590 [Sphaerochaetaceae bacterium]